ncbi:unnamed protein product [Polarella glacialis]|uniref:Alpha-1,3-glucosyltransferase n=1 Tax=Polarella glacialis TaxID=89957 RepID=A0A813J7V8_POLGL|nr:unnamed protein product [Polarella glacialis]
MVTRVMAWYPFFVLALLLCAIRFWSVNADDWAHLLADLFLIHGQIFGEQDAFPYLPNSWWPCFLMVYMLAWSPMHHVLASSSDSLLWTMFTISTLVAFPSALLEWTCFENVPSYALVQYLPTFFFGQAVAVWLVRQCMQVMLPARSSSSKRVYSVLSAQDLPLTVRFGATASVLILGVVVISFSLLDKVVLGRYPCGPLFLKGALLPIFGLLVAGMACEVDPLAKLLARAPLRWAGHLSLWNFLLQLPVYTAVEDLTGSPKCSPWAFAISLFFTSMAAHFCIEKPFRMLSARRRLGDK